MKWITPWFLGASLAAAAPTPALAGESSLTAKTRTAPNAAEAVDVDPTTQPAVSSVDEDRRLAQRVGRRLAWDARLAPYDLEVKVNHGIVNLSGSVSTMAESHRARRIANETSGVGGVVNAVYIDPALIPLEEGRAPEPPDDPTLTDRVRVMLADDSDLADEAIEVEVEDGIVQLDGTIRDYASEMRARRIAKSLYGVERVRSELDVATP